MKKILVIDDHEPMRRNVLMILEMEGFKPLNADNGQKGLELARKEKPDLILCDITMPAMDGYAVLQALREDKETATIPLIFLTARGEKLDVRMGMNYGADDYLTKPVGHEELLAAIAARLERKRAFDERAQEQLSNVRFTPDFSSTWARSVCASVTGCHTATPCSAARRGRHMDPCSMPHIFPCKSS